MGNEEKFSLDTLIECFKEEDLTLYSEFERIRQEKAGYDIKTRYAINYEKCQSNYQQLLYSVLYLFWPAIIRTEKWFYDKKNKERYRGDIYIKINKIELIIEINGRYHLLKEERNLRDQNKSKFLSESQIKVISWTNKWIENHWCEIPNHIKIITENINDKLKYIYYLLQSKNIQELIIIKEFLTLITEKK